MSNKWRQHRVLGNEDEDEIESNLTHVSHHLVGLKGMVIEMGSEADRQNEQLDRLNDKVHQIKLYKSNNVFI